MPPTDGTPPPPELSVPEAQRLFDAKLADLGTHEVAKIIDRNIASILEMRRQADRARTVQDRIADAITGFSGSMTFVYIHAAWFGLWVAMNLHPFGLPAFDPYPFGLLTMVVSLEAIFLATFVLVSQNRLAEIADKRADLDLQVNLLAEHEITRVLKIVDAIADHMGLAEGEDPEVDELKKDICPEVVLEEMDLLSHRPDCGRPPRRDPGPDRPR